MRPIAQSNNIVREVLDSIPIVSFLVDKEELLIQWGNKTAVELFNVKPEKIIGLSFTGLFLPQIDNPNFPDLVRRAGARDLRVVMNLDAFPDRDALLEIGTHRFERLLLNTALIGESILVSLRQLEHPLFNFFSSSFHDIIFFLDEGDRILEIASALTFFPFGGRTTVGRLLDEVISGEEARQIREQEAAARHYLESLKARKGRAWKKTAEDDFEHPEFWILDREFKPYWSFEPGAGLASDAGGRVAYLFNAQKIELAGRDYSFTLSVEQQEFHRFALLFQVPQANPWTLGGYTAGVNLFNDKPFLTLKKNSQFVLYHPLAAFPGRRYDFSVEKIGGVITLSLNGVPQCTFMDPEPIPDEQCHFGLFSIGRTRFARLTVQARPTVGDTVRYYRPVRLRMPGLGDRVFEAHLMPLAKLRHGGNLSQRALYFRDVTELSRVEEDRDAAARVGESLKAKDYYGFIGANPKIITVIDTVEKSADTDAAISILGPTGSGKEVLARAIHQRSRRRDNPFVKVDCSSIPAGLLESELFGHEKGAFTGAAERRIGKFESAETGTLFLDEIGNLSAATQAKLLDFLESHSVTRVGGMERMHLDVRIITATNADLPGLVKQGLFREDLYYRIQVVTLTLPPLRERIDDIPILVDHFLGDINRNHKLTVTGVDRPVMDAFLLHGWPGNVRELYNTLLQAAILQGRDLLVKVPEFSARGPAHSRRIFIPEKIREAKILGLLESAPYFSARDCRKALPVSMPTIQRDLRRLLRDGRLLSVGRGPSVRYVAASGPGK